MAACLALGGCEDMTDVIFPSNSNAAPTVDAGPDQVITLPATAPLDGTVTRDGGPVLAGWTYTWTKVSGPGMVSFADPNAVDTVVSFSAPGTYVLQLTATDGRQSASDQVTITVQG